MAHERSALAGAEGLGKLCEQVVQMPSTVTPASLTLVLGLQRLFLGISWLRRNDSRPGLQMALQDAGSNGQWAAEALSHAPGGPAGLR